MNTRSQLIAGRLRDAMNAKPGKTVCAAESLTSGRVQSLIGSISGASAYFVGGVTAYTVAQKRDLLGVAENVAAPVNGVSEETVRQLARGACRLFRATYSVATTGYAEETLEVAVPFAWWGVCSVDGQAEKIKTGRVEFPNLGRIEVQAAVAEAALEALVEMIEADQQR